jgi:hypothetical protein
MTKDTTIDAKFLLKDLTVIIPFVASSFAFAFVVGYFYAFDVSWFAFFSLSEHLVFALRALPVAIGGSVVFLIAVKIENEWKEKNQLQGRRRWLYLGWLCILLLAAISAFVSRRVGLAVSFLVIAIGTYFYRNHSPRPQLATELYWAVNLMMLSLLVGFVQGSSWSWGPRFFPCSPPPAVVEITATHQKFCGRIIAAGSSGVLIYNQTLGVRLVRQQSEVYEAPDNSREGILDCLKRLSSGTKATDPSANIDGHASP